MEGSGRGITEDNLLTSGVNKEHHGGGGGKNCRDLGIPPEIRTQHLPNTSQKCHGWSQLEPRVNSTVQSTTVVTMYRLLHCGRGHRFFSSPKRTDRLWGPHSLLFQGYRVSFPGIKRPGRDVDHSRRPSAVVKKE